MDWRVSPLRLPQHVAKSKYTWALKKRGVNACPLAQWRNPEELTQTQSWRRMMKHVNSERVRESPPLSGREPKEFCEGRGAKHHMQHTSDEKWMRWTIFAVDGGNLMQCTLEASAPYARWDKGSSWDQVLWLHLFWCQWPHARTEHHSLRVYLFCMWIVFPVWLYVTTKYGGSTVLPALDRDFTPDLRKISNSYLALTWLPDIVCTSGVINAFAVKQCNHNCKVLSHGTMATLMLCLHPWHVQNCEDGHNHLVRQLSNAQHTKERGLGRETIDTINNTHWPVKSRKELEGHLRLQILQTKVGPNPPNLDLVRSPWRATTYLKPPPRNRTPRNRKQWKKQIKSYKNFIRHAYMFNPLCEAWTARNARNMLSKEKSVKPIYGVPKGCPQVNIESIPIICGSEWVQ